MGRFDDLDDHLRREAAVAQMAEEERVRRLLEARAKHLPLLQRAYGVLGDYYVSLLQPRGYQLFPRRKEGPTPHDVGNIHSSTVLYAYVANILSPPDQRPYPHDNDPHELWRNPEIGELDYHISHPNVALHFATTLTPVWMPIEKRIGEDVKLKIEMSAWGRVKAEKEALTPLGISASFADGGWDHYKTFLSITPDADRVEEQAEAGLRILTPNIIHHKAKFYERLY